MILLRALSVSDQKNQLKLAYTHTHKKGFIYIHIYKFIYMKKICLQAQLDPVVQHHH